MDTAANGAVARDMLTNNKYDILLVDLNMPVINGTELYRTLRALKYEVSSRESIDRFYQNHSLSPSWREQWEYQ